MTNFVNFITDKIRPTVISAYLSGAGSEADFIGSDSSTMDYSKIGYVLTVYRKMLRENKVTSEINSIVSMLGMLMDDDGEVNYKTTSPTGFSLADMLVHEGRSDEDFTFVMFNNAIEGVSEYLEGIVNVSPAAGVGSALHMMIEYEMASALSALGTSVFETDVSNNERPMTALMYALKKVGDSSSKASRVNIYNLVKSKTLGNNPSYNDLFGANSTRSATPTSNDLTKFLLSSTKEGIENTIDALLEIIPGAPTASSAILDTVTKAEGLSGSSIALNLSGYAAGDEQNTGYSPLFYYVNRFKSSSDVDILNKLSTKFSPIAISIDNGVTEGYNPIGVLSASMTIDAGAWVDADLAGWISSALSGVGASTGYELFVGAGNVRDLANGNSVNAYGAVTNILKTINIEERRYVANAAEDADPFDPMPLISSILPSVIDAIFYQEWAIEFGQEV